MWFWGKPARMRPSAAGFATRCEFPDGSHEFVGFRRTAGKAARFARRDAAFYRRGPLRLAHGVVEISLRDARIRCSIR